MPSTVSRRSFLKTAAGLPLVLPYRTQGQGTAAFDPNFGTLTEAARAVRSGEISSLELTQQIFKRIEDTIPLSMPS